MKITQLLNTIDEHEESAAEKTLLVMHQEWWDFTKMVERKCMFNSWRRWWPKIAAKVTLRRWRQSVKQKKKGA